MLTRGREGAASGATLARHRVGNAWVVYHRDRMGDAAYALAGSLPADDGHELVVIDLPAEQPFSSWAEVAELIPGRRGGIRLVLGGRSRETCTLAGQWLARRLGRPVLVPDGQLFRGANGSLFVHAGAGSGWVRCLPRRSPRWEGKRYPSPVWDSREVADTVRTGSGALAEPVPGGMWLHAGSDDPQLARHRMRLIETLPCQREVFGIVLGCPGSAPIDLDDVACLWQRIGVDLRCRARFVCYGPVRVPSGAQLGQALAERLGEPITCYTGFPLGSAESPLIHTVRSDGGFGWQAFAREMRYRPRTEASGLAEPELVGYRSPLPGAAELSPGVFWYTQDAVVEVVPAGLWIRPPYQTGNSGTVRSASCDAEEHRLFFDSGDARQAARMRWLAHDLACRLGAATSDRTKIVPVSAADATPSRPAGVAKAKIHGPVPESGPAPGTLTADSAGQEPVAVVEAPTAPDPVRATPVAVVPEPEGLEPAEDGRQAISPMPGSMAEPVTSPGRLPPATDSVTEAGEDPAPSDTKGKPSDRGPARVQPTPEPAAAAVLSKRGLDEERAWLRRSLSHEFDTVASTISRVISEHPGVQGRDRMSSAAVLTDAVAVRLYLSANGAAIDDALRSAANGPHVPFARCVVSGLSRLPSHRGPTVFAASPTHDELELYRGRRLVTEWGFTSALTAPSADQRGTFDVLLWSMTARRTRLLEPSGDDNCAERVLYVPGTSFKVLDVTEPGQQGERGRILLRELAEGEVDVNGRVDANRVSLDELAVASLRKHCDGWAAEPPAIAIGVAARGRFGALPGLI